jgi:hypothetical protein
LQYLAADIERKVFAVDDSANEAQILRQKLLRIVHDEHALHVELYANLVFRLIKIKRSFRRYVENQNNGSCESPEMELYISL